jgi:hypothetical protein
MPNRILRDWTDSYTISDLSAEAERLFVRLIMKADDYGRFHADERLLKANCFPLQNVRDTDISRWLDECQKAGVIAVYQDARGRRYLQIANFKQRTRTSESKFPEPPTREHLPGFEPPTQERPTNDGQATVKRRPLSETNAETDKTPKAPKGAQGGDVSPGGNEKAERIREAWNARLAPALRELGEDWRALIGATEEDVLLEAVKALGEKAVKAKEAGFHSPKYSLADLEAQVSEIHRARMDQARSEKAAKAKAATRQEAPGPACPHCTGGGILYVVGSGSIAVDGIFIDGADVERLIPRGEARAEYAQVLRAPCVCEAGMGHPSEIPIETRREILARFAFKDQDEAEALKYQCDELKRKGSKRQ